MSARAERLGLEPGSVSDVAQKRENEGERRMPLDEEVAHSIAISLKRIADALDGDAGRYGLNEFGEALVGIQLASERGR